MGYPANGNQPNGTYDASNRLVTNLTGESYMYDYRGKRVVKWLSNGTGELYFCGIDGRKLTTLTCYTGLHCSSPQYNLNYAHD